MICAKCKHEYESVPLTWQDFVTINESNVRPFLDDDYKTICTKRCGCLHCHSISAVIGRRADLDVFTVLWKNAPITEDVKK